MDASSTAASRKRTMAPPAKETDGKTMKIVKREANGIKEEVLDDLVAPYVEEEQQPPPIVNVPSCHHRYKQQNDWATKDRRMMTAAAERGDAECQRRLNEKRLKDRIRKQKSREGKKRQRDGGQ